MSQFNSCTSIHLVGDRGGEHTVCGWRCQSQSQVPPGQRSTAAGSRQASLRTSHRGTDFG